MKYKIFQHKLDRFKSERMGFLVKSKEVADELAKVFEREELLGRGGQSAEYSTARAWGTYGNRAYVAYNYRKGYPGLSYGLSDGAGESLDELLKVTLEELKEYNGTNEQKPMDLEDKLKLFKAGTHVLHTPSQETYDKLMVELEKHGYRWKNGDEPTGDPKEWENFNSGTCVRLLNGRLCDGPKGHYEDHTDLGILTLIPEDFSTPQVITITSDGYHRVTAESNGITVEALCNPTDTFKLTKGVHLAAQRLLDKLAELSEETLVLPKPTKEENEFNVGDTVEVVGYHDEYLKSVVGKRAIITSTDGCGREKYKVKYQEIIEGYDEWWSYPEELKLVTEEDDRFHRGDIVEVVKNFSGFTPDPVGLQGVVTEESDRPGKGTKVKLPTHNITLYFYKSELKLIRRGNC